MMETHQVRRECRNDTTPNSFVVSAGTFETWPNIFFSLPTSIPPHDSYQSQRNMSFCGPHLPSPMTPAATPTPTLYLRNCDSMISPVYCRHPRLPCGCGWCLERGDGHHSTQPLGRRWSELALGRIVEIQRWWGRSNSTRPMWVWITPPHA